MKERMFKLYEDWESAQNLSTVKKARKTLKEATKNPSSFTKVVKMMGLDGSTFTSYFNESNFSDNSFTAKRQAARYILEKKGDIEIKPVTELSPDNFKLSYEQMDDRSNSMVSYIEAGTSNGSATEIMRAIVGGNMEIAAAMTMASWNRLSVGDRNAILNITNVHGAYNQGSGIVKDSGEAKFYSVDIKEGPIKKKGDMSKGEFMAKAFPMSDPKNTSLYKDK